MEALALKTLDVIGRVGRAVPVSYIFERTDMPTDQFIREINDLQAKGFISLNSSLQTENDIFDSSKTIQLLETD